MSSSGRETLLQFGGGGFLRAFTDLFLHQANAADDTHGRAVVVTSTLSDRARWINEQEGCYHVALRGLVAGQPVDETHRVDRALSRAIAASSDWRDVLDVSTSPDLRWIVSNTTEAGLQLAEDEIGAPDAEGAPVSFPAKLLGALAHRQSAGLGGVTILPCELVDANADRLQGLVVEQARRWQLPGTQIEWVTSACRWVNTLVDRIVPGRPTSHPMLDEDALLTAAEPFALWAVEDDGGLDLFAHGAIERVADVMPYSLRKVRILNGAHTALVAHAMPRGFETVGDAVRDDEIRGWLESLLHEEILPALGDRVAGAEAFAATTLERFANPWIEHRLADIALHHETKVQTRLQPSLDDYVERFGHRPPILSRLLS